MSDSVYYHDISIDIHNLDWEWGRQSSVYLKYGKMFANTAYQRDKAEEVLDNTKAKIRRKLREKKEMKVSDMDAEVNLNPEVKEAYENFIQLKFESNMLQNVIKALEHKKASLENLTKLYLVGYFSEPKISKEAQETFSDESSAVEQQTLKRNPRLQKLKKKGK